MVYAELVIVLAKAAHINQEVLSAIPAELDCKYQQHPTPCAQELALKVKYITQILCHA